jgi:hypothetical protein
LHARGCAPPPSSIPAGPRSPCSTSPADLPAGVVTERLGLGSRAEVLLAAWAESRINNSVAGSLLTWRP